MNTSTNHSRLRVVLLFALLAGGLAAAGCDPPGGGSAPGESGDQPEKGQAPYYQGLIAEYRSNLAEDPHNLAALIGLANALYDSSQWREAIEYYEQALQLNPHNADTITDMGTCYRNLGMPDRAIAAYERSLRIEPAHANTLFNLGVVYGHDKKDYAKAIAAWDQLLRTAPNHPRAAHVHEMLRVFRKAQKEGGR